VLQAVLDENLVVVKLLVAHGADVNKARGTKYIQEYNSRQ
jgi:hypothetical protein